MTTPGGTLRRCGLDILHESHPVGGLDGDKWCDGQPVLTGPPPAADGAGLWLAADTPRPWNWASLTPETAQAVRAKLDQWVQHYNHTWAVRDAQLVYACWPAHPAVAYELAALYAAWVDAYCGPLANAGSAMVWLDRWLPGFQMRLRDRFGIGEDACTPSGHNAKWNPVQGKLRDVDKPVEGEPQAVLADLCDNPGMPPIVPSD